MPRGAGLKSAPVCTGTRKPRVNEILAPIIQNLYFIYTKFISFSLWFPLLPDLTGTGNLGYGCMVGIVR